MVALIYEIQKIKTQISKTKKEANCLRLFENYNGYHCVSKGV